MNINIINPGRIRAFPAESFDYRMKNPIVINNIENANIKVPNCKIVFLPNLVKR